MDDISSAKSGVINCAASTSEDASRRNPLNEQYSMARLVRELRKLTGLTQEKFAAKLGVTFPTINRWENDRAEIEANDWSLTPGRYVGVAPEEEDEDFDFEEALRDIHVELEDLNAEAVQLAAGQKILRLFEETVSPLHQQMELLKRQNTSLAIARDLLLPKLMNGEVAV